MIAIPIIFVPLIIFINSFALGKLYKRFCSYLKSYLTIILGLVSYLGFAALIFEILSLFTINFSTILYSLLIYQLILILIYIINWKNIFITYKINWSLFLIFLALIVIACATYIITRNFNGGLVWNLPESNNFYDYYISKDFINKNPNDIIIFEFNNLISFDKFNFVYVFISAICYLFKINSNDLRFFYTYLNILIYCFIIASLTVYAFFNTYYNDVFIKQRILISISLVFILSILAFWLNSYMLIILTSYLLIIVHKSKQNQIPSNISIWITNFVVLFGIFWDINFILAAILINSVQLFLSYRVKKYNATDYNFLSLFSTLLLIANVINNKYASFVMVVLIFSLYALYIFYKSSNVAKRINSRIDNFLYKQINVLFLVIIFITFVISISFILTTKDYKIILDPWYIISKDNDKIWFYSINSLFWAFNVFFLIYSVVKNNYLRIKLFNKFKKTPELDSSILGIVLFWNPISISTYDLIISQKILSIPINFQVFGFGIFVPLLAIINTNINYNSHIKLKISLYLFSILIASALIITSINLGVKP